jgi:GntR family transcriptional regulator
MAFDPALFQRSRAPIYLQTAKLLRLRIEQGEWRVGERMPRIEELMAVYGVARSTLREALAQLESEGVIRRSRGSGTFVIKDLSAQRWFKLATEWDDLIASVADLRVRLLPIGRATHSSLPEVGFIEGRPAEAYRHLRRVHYRQDLAYCLIDIWLDRHIFNMSPEAFTKAPVLTRLAKVRGLTIAAAKQVVRVTVSDADTAAFLNIGVGDPIADVRRAITDAAGHIVYYAYIRYPAQLIEIEIDLLRDGRRAALAKNNTRIASPVGKAREGNVDGSRKRPAPRR